MWGALSVLCAVAFAFVVGIIHPEEKVNALWLVVASGCFLVLAYRFYGAFLAARVTDLDDRRVTPAIRLNDGSNFHPTNKYIPLYILDYPYTRENCIEDEGGVPLYSWIKL